MLLADIADAKVNVCVSVKIIISSLKREGGERRRERERERERFAFTMYATGKFVHLLPC